MKKIIIVTDTWDNLNGVVTWIKNVQKELSLLGFKSIVIHPGLFFNFPLPRYSELKMAPFAIKKVENILKCEKPDYIHIATAGPLGLCAAKVCLKNKWHFNTFYHTRLPEYMHGYLKLGVFKHITYRYLRWFHNAGSSTIVGTPSMKEILSEKGFNNLVPIFLGIDRNLFKKNENAKIPDGLTKPIFVFLGRVAIEKNIEAFLSLDLPGSKLVIGNGPAKISLQKKYKDTLFVGYKKDQEVVDLLSISDVFVFPSKTDTFGLAIVEALACGLPVAAYDVTGPKDIITNGIDGFIGDNLEENAKKCLTLNSRDCIEKSSLFSWKITTTSFVDNLVDS